MVSATTYAKDFGAYMPSIDNRRRDNPCIMAGQNFLHELDGPRSAFASSFANYYDFGTTTRKKVHSFYVDGDYIYATGTGLWKIDGTSKMPVLLYAVTITNTFWPWTYAQVGSLHYFAQYEIGLIQYNSTTGTFTLVSTPQAVRGVCESYGRLVCLGTTTVFWSALDDGTDLTPSTVTGAGAQALAILSKTAFKVEAVDDGFVVFTDKGLLKGEFVQANFVFRFYVLSRDVKVFTPNAIINTFHLGIIILDPTGLHVCENGTAPTPWQPEMSIFLRDRFMKQMDKTLYGLCQLSYAEDDDTLYVSIADNALEGKFRIAYTFSIPSGKWSNMRHAHTSIVDMNISTLSQQVSGFVDTAGFMRYFTKNDYIEIVPDAPYVLEDVIRRAASDPVSRIEVDTGGAAVYIGQTDIRTAAEDMSPYDALLTGAYILDDASEVMRFTLGQDDLSAYIDVGPFRYVEQKLANETSSIDSLVIGTVAVAQGITTDEDWLTLSGAEDEDWLNFADGFDEDWGADFTPEDDFDLDLYTTDDGVNIQLQGAERLEPLYAFGAGFQYAPMGFSGAYHHLRISASSPGQSFSPKFIEMSGLLTGSMPP